MSPEASPATGTATLPIEFLENKGCDYFSSASVATFPKKSKRVCVRLGLKRGQQ